MRTWAKSTARTAVVTASFVALGVSAIPANAFADATNGDGSVLGGNQVDLPVSAPVDVSGNGAGIVGSGHGVSRGGASVLNGGGGGGQHTSGTGSVGGGNQVNAPISLPVNACGNAVALIGKADAGCPGGSSVHNGGGAGGQQTSGAHSVLGGNQVNAPISAPVDVCGNAVAIIGKAEAGCEGGATVHNGGAGHGSGQSTDGSLGVIAGNQVNAPISAPVNVCGNAVAIVGEAVAGCEGGAIVKNGGDTGAGQRTSGLHSVLGGNQANAPVSAPVDVCGNAIGNALAECEGGASVRNGGHGTGGQTTDGTSSVIGGNQANAPISVPATVCGNAAALVGEAGAYCEGGAHARSSSGGDQHTSGTGSVGGGNQGNAPITAPVDVCGNAAAVVGKAAAHCNGQTLVEGSQGPGGHTSGNGSVGGGNQAHAPAKAPVDACGNVGAVVGRSLAHCQDGPGFGGYHPYARSAGDPLPVNPGSALPVVPQLPGAGDRAAGTPGTPGTTGKNGTAGLPVTGLPNVSQALSGATSTVNRIPATRSVPVSDALSATNLLPRTAAQRTAAQRTAAQRTAAQRTGAPALGPVPGSQLPAAETLPVRGDLPTVNGLLGGAMTPKVTPKVNGLPKAPRTDAERTVHTGGNGMTIATLPVDPSALPTRALPAVPVVPVAPNARTSGTALPVTGLPGTKGVKHPGTGSVKLPAGVALPAGTAKAPKVGGAVTDLGPVRNVADNAPLTSGTESGSLWALGAAALAAALSGAVTLGRRLRPGRR
ncbi:chaplin [Actinomadura opuntiae]|uniref:chaplin n=1 Tax=Actinomadura sp. OS1-43 TaxID=604315 RepID=UPI00255B3183|nr:chaplin [Actinomadura sp. OS1-43]MDL4813756.1 chaplin [Actinomadura sp. OS1-43]